MATFNLTVSSGVEYKTMTQLDEDTLARRIDTLREWFPDIEFSVGVDPA